MNGQGPSRRAVEEGLRKVKSDTLIQDELVIGAVGWPSPVKASP